MNLALIGLRCAGKTTLGRLLASQLGRDFIDLDERTLARFEQATITDVWRELGEEAWREAELSELDTALNAANSIIALGGGVPMIPAARDAINRKRAAGALRVVYVRCDAAVLARRRAGSIDDSARPTWSDATVMDEIERTQRERDPIYRDLADHVFDVSAASPQQSAEQLLAWLKSVES